MCKIRNVRSYFSHHNYQPGQKPKYDLKLDKKETKKKSESIKENK